MSSPKTPSGPIDVRSLLEPTPGVAEESPRSHDAQESDREQLEELWGALGALDAETEAPPLGFTPGVAIDRQSPKPVRSRLAAAAALLVALFAGLALGSWRARETDRVAELSADIESLRAAVAVALLDGRTPSSRLTAIGASQSLPEADPSIRDALVRALETDPSDSVRLGALEALTRLELDDRLRSRLLDTLPVQRSALVQMALLDQIPIESAPTAPAASTEPLRRLLERSDLLPEVEERATALIGRAGETL